MLGIMLMLLVQIRTLGTMLVPLVLWKFYFICSEGSS